MTELSRQDLHVERGKLPLRLILISAASTSDVRKAARQPTNAVIYAAAGNDRTLTR